MNIVYFPFKGYDIDIHIKIGVDTIDIEIKDHNRIKELFQNFHSKLEDVLFSIIQKLPERFIPHWVMEWMDQYLTKRIYQLEQETIKLAWKNVYLQKAVTEIHDKQQDTKKAPSDD